MAETRYRLAAFPRLHLGLVDCGGATSRAFGGFGVALEGPATMLESTPAQSFSFESAVMLEDRTRAEANQVLKRYEALHGPARVRVELLTMPPEHIGLGSKTALLLSLVRLVSQASGVHLSSDQLVMLTGRGGASGIGVNSFFSGGWLVDVGHPWPKAPALLPSSAIQSADRAPVIFCHPVNEQWRFHLILPPGIRRAAGDEVDFFKRNTPIEDRSVLQTLALIYHGALPAILEGNLPDLGRSIAGLQATGFKQIELSNQTDQVRDCIADLTRLGVPAGMSSMGPLVFAISLADEGVRSAIMTIAAERGAQYLGTFAGANTGAHLEEIR